MDCLPTWLNKNSPPLFVKSPTVYFYPNVGKNTTMLKRAKVNPKKQYYKVLMFRTSLLLLVPNKRTRSGMI